MATIDLGKIKLVWRGTFSGGTAYTVDDVVQHTDSGLTSSFICTTASTGNAPSTGGSVHSSWAYLAKGGVAGTDVGTTLTTQGDVLYRDGSGLQRLAKGTAAQVLKMNTAANAPEWGNLSSDWVLLNSSVTSSSVSSVSIDGHYTSDYDLYKLFIYRLQTSDWMWSRLNFGGSPDTNSNYHWSGFYNYRNASGESTGDEGSNSSNYIGTSWWNSGVDEFSCGEITIIDPLSTSRYKGIGGQFWGMDTGQTQYGWQFSGFLSNQKTTASSGITFLVNSSGTITNMTTKLYGLKTS